MAASVELVGDAIRATSPSGSGGRRRVGRGDGARAGRMVSPRLVGRDDELACLVEGVTGPPVVVVVEGESGIGKTRLIGELERRLDGVGPRVVVGQCRRVREPFPLGPLLDALRSVGADLNGSRATPAMGSLRPLLPELADVLPPRPEPLDDRLAERHRLFRGLRDGLAALGPAVLVMEDLHWVDGQTVDFLHYLLSDPPSTLSVVLTYRRDEASADVRGITARISEPLELVRVELGPMDTAATGALVAAILDTDEISDEFAAYLRERASGVPFAVEQLLALLRERGTLTPRGGGWVRQALDELGVPAAIRDSVHERVIRLDDDARTALEAAAVLQTPVQVSTLVDTCDLREDRVRAGLDEGLGSGLLAEYADRVGFRHVLAAQAVYEDIPLPRRQSLHGRAADALSTLEPVPLGQIAHHRHEAGQADAWVVAAERAADLAIEAGDDAEAARLLEQVLREAPLGAEVRARLAIKLGRVALGSPRPADLIAPLSGALDDEAPLQPTVRGQLHFWLGLLMHQTGHDPKRQRALLEAAVEELDDQPALRASAMICLAMRWDSLTWVRQAREVLPEVDDPAYEVFLQSKVGAVMVTAGDPHWREVADHIREQTGGQPRHRDEVRAYSTIGNCAGCAGHHELAADWLTWAQAAGDCRDDERLALSLRTNLAVVDFFRGRWDGLRHRLDGLVEMSAELPRIRIDLDAVGCRLALAQADTVGAARQLDELCRGIERLDANDMVPMAVDTRIRLALTRDDAVAAVDAAEQLLDTSKAGNLWPIAVRALPATVEALLMAGRGADVTAWLARVEGDLPDLDAPLAPAALAHGHGLLAMTEERWQAATDHFATAAASYERLSCPYEAAAAREQAAAAARFAGEVPDADRYLRDAAATYQKLGARWDVDRVAALARQHEVSLPARHRGGRRGYGADLSPRERKVAELVALGRTNQEIADELYVSLSTIKHHVAAAMRKFDVSSRIALAHRLAEADRVAQQQNWSHRPIASHPPGHPR